MELARVVDLTSPPVVGEFYLVPTVRYQWFNLKANWPVFPSFHEDKEHLNFPWPHYHVDPRFIAPSVAERVEAWGGGHLGTLAQTHPLSIRTRKAVSENRYGDRGVDIHQAALDTEPHPDIVWRPRQCHREQPQYIFGDAEPIQRLREAFAVQQCPRNKAGWVCPHKSYPLGSVEPDDRGVITCPLHGLQIDAQTGTVLPPPAAIGR